MVLSIPILTLCCGLVAYAEPTSRRVPEDPAAFRIPTDVNPDRYVDGSALANRLTPWLLRHATPRARRRDPRVSSPLGRLHAGGEFYEETDTLRTQLDTWILAQPHHSIEIHQLYEEAFRLSQGDTLRGLILVWDVLRDDWDNEQLRNLTDRASRLTDITGERALFDGTNHEDVKAIRGDNFSAWYHLAGTALYSFMKENSRLRLIPGSWTTRFMIFLEEHVLYNEFIDPLKRRQLDLAGATMGERLARNLRRYRDLPSFERSLDAHWTEYMVDRPDIYGDAWRLRDDQAPRQYRTEESGRTTGIFERMFRLSELLNERPSPAMVAELLPRVFDTNETIRNRAVEMSRALLSTSGHEESNRRLEQGLLAIATSTEETETRRLYALQALEPSPTVGHALSRLNGDYPASLTSEIRRIRYRSSGTASASILQELQGLNTLKELRSRLTSLANSGRSDAAHIILEAWPRNQALEIAAVRRSRVLAAALTALGITCGAGGIYASTTFPDSMLSLAGILPSPFLFLAGTFASLHPGDQSTSLRYDLLKAIEAHPSVEWGPLLIHLTNDPSAEIRERAVRALVNRRRTDATDSQLHILLRDADSEVRRIAAEALGIDNPNLACPSLRSSLQNLF